jgi:hypothetical protein
MVFGLAKVIMLDSISAMTFVTHSMQAINEQEVLLKLLSTARDEEGSHSKVDTQTEADVHHNKMFKTARRSLKFGNKELVGDEGGRTLECPGKDFPWTRQGPPPLSLLPPQMCLWLPCVIRALGLGAPPRCSAEHWLCLCCRCGGGYKRCNPGT